MLSKALEMGVCFHRGLILWGTWREAAFLGLLKEGKKYLYLEKFYEEFERYEKKPCK
jgi:hypothetical protein